jgi:hypothetical protein
MNNAHVRDVYVVDATALQPDAVPSLIVIAIPCEGL